MEEAVALSVALVVMEMFLMSALKVGETTKHSLWLVLRKRDLYINVYASKTPSVTGLFVPSVPLRLLQGLILPCMRPWVAAEPVAKTSNENWYRKDRNDCNSGVNVFPYLFLLIRFLIPEF